MSSSNGDDTNDSVFQRWRRRFALSTGLGLSDGEKEEWYATAKEAKCMQWKTELWVTSPKVVFMLEQLKATGHNVKPSHVRCTPCDGTRVSAAAPHSGNIFLCSGTFINKNHMEDALTHELLHLWDHATFNIDWNNLRHHACSEIRAENLSGDCRWGREIQRGLFSFTGQQQDCVRRRAIASVLANPACPDQATAERVVNEVFQSCIKDTRPFDEIY